MAPPRVPYSSGSWLPGCSAARRAAFSMSTCFQATQSSQKRTNGAAKGAVQQRLLAAGLQRGAAQRLDDIAHVVVDHVLQLVGRAVQGAARRAELAARRVLLHLRDTQVDKSDGSCCLLELQGLYFNTRCVSATLNLPPVGSSSTCATQVEVELSKDCI